jgi:branched-chain amino acid transport system ATP-binding protein
VTLLHATIQTAGYGQGNVLQDVEVSVGEREIVVVLGRNGAGKTTLLRGLSGLLPHFSGGVEFGGTDVTRRPSHARVRMGLVHVPEGRHVFTDLTVMENLHAAALASGKGKGEPQALEQVDALFPKLLERARQRAGTLSGGEQQMLAIARGLMLAPRLLMVDEASLGLAPIIVERLYEALRRIGTEFGISVLVVEQNAHSGLGIADRGYVMERGAVALAGNTSEVLEIERVTSVYMGRK